MTHTCDQGYAGTLSERVQPYQSPSAMPYSAPDPWYTELRTALLSVLQRQACSAKRPNDLLLGNAWSLHKITIRLQPVGLR